MPRNYRQKNAVVKGSRLTAEDAMQILFNYICQTRVREIAVTLDIAEPTVHRLIRKFQDRLYEDTRLLALCCGFEFEGIDHLAPYLDLLDLVKQGRNNELALVMRCIYDCPSRISMNYIQFIKYFKDKQVVFDTEEPLHHKKNADFIFRHDYCQDCKNPLKDKINVEDISALALSDILRPEYKKNFNRHLPVMIIRALARLRADRAIKDGKLYDANISTEVGGEDDVEVEVLYAWLKSAEPYLKIHPL